jgi:hypothetical protein
MDLGIMKQLEGFGALFEGLLIESASRPQGCTKIQHMKTRTTLKSMIIALPALCLLACTPDKDSSKGLAPTLDNSHTAALVESAAQAPSVNPLNNANAPADYYKPERASQDKPVATGTMSKAVIKSETRGNDRQNFEQFMSEALCQDTLKTRLKKSSIGGVKWTPLNQWSRMLTASFDGAVTFVSPTTLPGMWVRVTFYLNREAKIEMITQRFSTTYEFDSVPQDPRRLDCSKMRKTSKRSPMQRLDDKKNFTDHTLVEQMKKNKSGVLYLWSPNMSFSYSTGYGVDRNGIGLIKKAVQQLGGEVALDIAMDPAAKQSQLDRILANPKVNQQLNASMLRPAHSLEVMMRGMDHHYPSIIVYSNGRIGKGMLPGVATADGYAKFIKKQIAEIQADLAEGK